VGAFVKLIRIEGKRGAFMGKYWLHINDVIKIVNQAQNRLTITLEKWEKGLTACN